MYSGVLHVASELPQLPITPRWRPSIGCGRKHQVKAFGSEIYIKFLEYPYVEDIWIAGNALHPVC